MGITLNVWIFSAIIGVAYIGGYLMSKWMVSQPMAVGQAAAVKSSSAQHFSGRPVASPVAGNVEALPEEEGKGIRIYPENTKLYSPVSGKIVRLYPGGNEFLIRTDYDAYLHLKVGERSEDMVEDYYRTRVVQNEIISKGKLLMEFDLEGLHADGYETAVLLSVENSGNYREVSTVEKTHVRDGEDCLWIAK